MANLTVTIQHGKMMELECWEFDENRVLYRNRIAEMIQFGIKDEIGFFGQPIVKYGIERWEWMPWEFSFILLTCRGYN